MITKAEIKLSFFTGPHCSLCDDAKALIDSVGEAARSFEITYFNVKENPEHYHLYALRIPVLRREDTLVELGWPFNEQQLRTFLS